MRGEETEQRGRFRARLLRVNEPVPVFYFDNIKIKRENKELYQWLLSGEGQAQVWIFHLADPLLLGMKSGCRDKLK